MKRKTGRIILGTAAVAATISLAGCRSRDPGTDRDEGNTAITQESGDTEESASVSISKIEVFDVEENFNEVVYGPPAER